MKRIPRLHLIGPLDGLTAAEYADVAAAAAEGGVDGVHVRLPGAAADDVLALARELRGRIGNAALIVNDRLDVALVAGADGAQLGERSLSVSDARGLLGDALLIGRSVHDVEGARRTADDGADYLLAGHVFDTISKAGTPGRGLDWLAEIAAAVDVPVIAIGGVTIERIPAVMETGAYGVAMGRELLRAADPKAAAQATSALGAHHMRPASRRVSGSVAQTTTPCGGAT
ncbi:MAG TPA: thiamine phosphate synthase [Thermomicrobiales bacterium]|nr:thiamine phosphate synthase [Thermomicrobiales bacterium]